MKTVKIDFDAIPEHEKDRLAYSVLQDMKEAFKKPEIVAEYEQWLAEQEEVETARAH